MLISHAGAAGIVFFYIIVAMYILWKLALKRSEELEAGVEKYENLVFISTISIAIIASIMVYTGYTNWLFLAIIPSLIVCSATDIASRYIFDYVTYPTFIAIIAFAVVLGFGISAIEGAALCSLFLLPMWAVTKGKALGFADVKLALCIGAALGPFSGCSALAWSFIFSSIIAVLLIVFKVMKRTDYQPFGAYMALGAIVGAFYPLPLLDIIVNH